VVKVIKGLQAEWGMCSRTVSLGKVLSALSYWNNTIAVGCHVGDIFLLDGVTGSQVAALSGHTETVRSLTFSSDGTSLVSGSDDWTVKLWDVQTGGVVKTFGHTGIVWSVSISADCTRIASGSGDNTIHLWDIQTGECHCVIKQQHYVYHVCFSPKDPQYLLSISNNKVWQWDIDGHQTATEYDGSYVAFSLDGTKFVSYNGAVVTVQNSDSRAIMTKFSVPDDSIRECCFSPDSRLIAVAAGFTAYVWDITGSDPHLVETHIGHTQHITSLAFSSPSSFISASYDKSVKFWQIDASSVDLVTNNPKPTPSPLASIESVSLQARGGIAISSDSDGVVKAWDILTGLCKTSFQTPAKDDNWRDAQLIDGRLILVWLKVKKVHIWDTGKGELLQSLDGPEWGTIRISGDGSKVFCLGSGLIQAWSMWTWEPVGQVKIQKWDYMDPLQVYGSEVWVRLEDSSTLGWDFGISGSSPVPLSNLSIGRPHLDFISGPWRFKDTVTGEVVFQLPGRYTTPNVVQWDGQYLVAGYKSGEVLILDFHHMYPQ